MDTLTNKVRMALTDEELDEFIDRAEYHGSETWWVSDFCDEAIGVANELKEWRQANDARA